MSTPTPDRSTPDARTAATVRPVPAGTPDEVSATLDALVDDSGFPGALASVRDADGSVRNYAAGDGVPLDGVVRIGSNTKTFTAVALLQLVGEGVLDLEAPVERHLPGLLRGEGIDGELTSVRHVLQHTSGLPDYMATAGDPSGYRYRYADPRDLLDAALAVPALFAPGERWSYSNTNYVVAGLLLQAVTGRPWSEQVHERVIARLGLQRTYVPATGELGLRGEHPRGFLRGADGVAQDHTEFDPSIAWAAGAVVAPLSEFNRFAAGLLRGDLLDPVLLAEMQTTVAAEGYPGSGYGLGLASFPQPDGATAWGHGGDIFGAETRGWATDDGRAACVAVTALPADAAGAGAVLSAATRAFAAARA